MKQNGEKAQTMISTAKDVALDAAREMRNINEGAFPDLVVPHGFEFESNLFKNQLSLETYDYEGIRRRFELYSALRRYTPHVGNKDCWSRAFGTKQNIWESVSLGLGYLHNSILKLSRDIPHLASRYLPFCTTFGCEFRKGGCLFSICEDIFGLLDIIYSQEPEELKLNFENFVLQGLGFSLDDIYEPVLKMLQMRSGLPLSLSSKPGQNDPYITLKFIASLLRTHSKNGTKDYKNIIRQCYDNKPNSSLYFTVTGRRGKILIDDSETLYMKIGSLLSTISSQAEIVEPRFVRFITERKSVAIDILGTQKPEYLIGPTYGRDRYAAIGWSILSDIPTVLSALEFLIDTEEFNPIKNTQKNDKQEITVAICKGLQYLIDCRIPDFGIWPVVNLEKLDYFEPKRDRRSYWDGTKEIDKILIDHPESFNISFSNTVDSIVMLLRGANTLKILWEEK
jgi:hypothetical protein